jgi:hypothetical protein
VVTAAAAAAAAATAERVDAVLDVELFHLKCCSMIAAQTSKQWI